MAIVPLSGTNIRLLSDVPFSNDYKHTRWFDTRDEQTNYFYYQKPAVHLMINCNFQRIEGRHYMKVNKSIDDLMRVNYMMFKNPREDEKWFYGFVTKMEYIQKETTYVYFEIDVFQTWKFDMRFKPSFVIREHQKLFSNGMPIVNTIDEGLNYGTDYETVSVERILPSDGYKWFVIASKQPFHVDTTDEDKASMVGMVQPLTYYVIPFKDGNKPADVRIGTSIIDMSDPLTILRELRKDTAAVGNIVSMYVTDYIGVNYFFVPDDGTTGDYFRFSIADGLEGVMVGETAQMCWVKDVNNFAHKDIEIHDDKYKGFISSDESKLFMYPYCVTILDDFQGNRVEIKNEYVNDPTLTVRVKGSLGTSNKVSYAVRNYNVGTLTQHNITISDEYALINSKPNDIPIINDMLAAFIQGNRNTQQNSLDTTVWNGITSMIGGGINTVASGASLNAGAVAGSATSMVQGAGNSILAIQGFEAKIKDISNVPPSIGKMGGNTIYETGNGFNGLFIMKKQIKYEYRKKLRDFFQMYGYKTNELKVPNFHTRRYWNFVQTESCMITGNFNNDDLQELKTVFDKGITLWHTDDVGNYALDNEVL